MAAPHRGQILQAVITLRSTGGTGDWIPFGPVRGKNIVATPIWTGTTVGTAVRLQGTMATGSTDVKNILLRKSSQVTAQAASTSGVAANMFNFLRLKSTAGVISAAKYVAFHIAAVPST
jgi:hypothetical protein